jgi:uncharacterized tellurite resistance protein B-like protein
LTGDPNSAEMVGMINEVVRQRNDAQTQAIQLSGQLAELQRLLKLAEQARDTLAKNINDQAAADTAVMAGEAA